MAGTIVSGSHLTGIVLNDAGTENPATVASGGYVTNTGTTDHGDAIYGAPGTAWTVTNLGSVNGVSTVGAAIYLAAGGTVTNGSATTHTPQITADRTAIAIENAPGTVNNFGTIRSSATGTSGVGVYLNTGGTITNEAGGLIAAYRPAVAAKVAAATVANYGTIENTGTGHPAIYLGAGGVVTNGASGATTALITSPDAAITILGGNGTINNFGTILRSTGGTSGAGAYLGHGGIVTNGSTAATHALIKSAFTGVAEENLYGTITNFGTIESDATGTSGVGVYLNAGGTITNAAGGLIAAYRSALAAVKVAATLTNDGTVSSTGSVAPAVYLGDGGTITNGADISSALISGKGNGIAVKGAFGVVTNLGTIRVTTGGTQGAAVYIGDGGVVTNGSTAATHALIVSALAGVAEENQYGTVTNFGTIDSDARTGVGVYLNDGGIINNAAGGLITAYRPAIDVVNVGATLTNDGMIENTGSVAAVYFGTFGSVTNAGTIETTSTHAALNFKTVGTVTNTGLIAAAAGTGIVIGETVATAATITVDNDATITGDTGIVISSLDAGFNTIVNAGTITGTEGTALEFGGGDDVLVVEPGSVLNGAVGNFHPGDRIDFADEPGTSVAFSDGVLTLMNGSTAVASLTLSGSFSQSQFAIGSDQNGGTNVTLNAPATIFAAPQLGIASFGAGAAGGDWTSQDLYPRALGDVTGNGLDDIVGFGDNGVYVSLSNGDGTFQAPILASSDFGAAPSAGGWTSQDLYPREVADVTGNGRSDIVAFGSAGVYVSLANADGTFQSPILAFAGFGASASAGGWTSNDLYPRELADVTGNGRADIVAFGSAGVYVSLANADGTFQAPFLAFAGFGASASAGDWTSQNLYPRFLADVTGNGRDDIVAFGSAGVYVALANANGTFQAPFLALPDFGASSSAGGWTSEDQYPRELADVNGDGRADIVAFGQNGVFVALGQANGTFAAPTTDLQNFGFAASAGGWTSQDLYPRLLGDVTSADTADIVGFGSSGAYVSLSQGQAAQLAAAMATFSAPGAALATTSPIAASDPSPTLVSASHS